MLAAEETSNEAPSTAPEPDIPAAESADVPETEKSPEVSVEDALRTELASAQQERAELLDKLQRAQAEFENIRKRLQKDKDDVVRYAASDTIRSLLPVVDDFERAIAAEGVPGDVKQGLELIHRRIFEVFQRAGLTAIEEHDSFDPNLHFAVDRAPATEEQSDHQILEVYQKGYRFKDRLLRASMVKVAVKE